MTSRLAIRPNGLGLHRHVVVNAVAPAQADSPPSRRPGAYGNIALRWFVLRIALHDGKRYEWQAMAASPGGASIRAGFSQTLLPACT